MFANACPICWTADSTFGCESLRRRMHGGASCRSPALRKAAVVVISVQVAKAWSQLAGGRFRTGVNWRA